MKNDDVFRLMLLELNKILCIILVIPVSSCTSERSFSAFSRLKMYNESNAFESINWHF